MNQISPADLETAFVPPGTPMLSDLIRRFEEQPLAESGLRPERRRDMISALRRASAALDRAPHRVPANPNWLRPRLARVAPAALGLSDKTWSNILSNLHTALEHLGVVKRVRRRTEDLSPEWQRLRNLTTREANRSLRASLSRFVHFLDGQGIAPGEVEEGHALAYRAALELSEMSRSPETSYRAAVSAWNLAAERLPDWPQCRLRAPSSLKRVALPLEAFPTSFRADFAAWLSSLQKADPFDPDGRIEPLRPNTVELYRSLLQRFASTLVRAGLEIGEIDGIAALVAPSNAKLGLKWMLEQNGGKTSVNIKSTAQLLHNVGHTYVRLPKDEQAELSTMLQRVWIRQRQGLTEKNRQRLRSLDDKETLGRLLRLPERLAGQSRAKGPSYKAALRFEEAVAISILLHCPIRIGNLAAIHIERNIQRPGNGRTYLDFGANEVKNHQAIEFELPKGVIALIDEHLSTWQPFPRPEPTPWLFPKRDGVVPMVGSRLAKYITTRIRKEVSIEFNAHLFRHLAAKIWLEANPGSYEVVRRLLGHSAVSQTLNVYAGFEAGTATRLFSKLIETGKV